MLQTLGPNEDPKIRTMVLADICRLRKMPDLAQRLESYQPQPDPLAQEKAQLEVELLKAQIANERAKAMSYQASAQLDQAKVGTEQAQARESHSNSDLKDLDYVEQESGVKQERDLQKQRQQAEANTRMKVTEQLVKHAAKQPY